MLVNHIGGIDVEVKVFRQLEVGTPNPVHRAALGKDFNVIGAGGIEMKVTDSFADVFTLAGIHLEHGGKIAEHEILAFHPHHALYIQPCLISSHLCTEVGGGRKHPLHDIVRSGHTHILAMGAGTHLSSHQQDTKKTHNPPHPCSQA